MFVLFVLLGMYLHYFLWVQDIPLRIQYIAIK